MKLAVLTNILTPYRIPLFEALQRRIDDLTVLLMAEREENRDWKLSSYRFKTEVLPGVHLRPPGRPVSLHLNYGVTRALRRLNPDMVLSGGFGPANLAACLYCRLSGKKFIGWGELTLREPMRLSTVQKSIRRWITTRSAGSIASSGEAAVFFVHYGAKPETVLKTVTPFNVGAFYDRAEASRREPGFLPQREKYSRPILLSVGRITNIKGYQELFKIYQRVIASRPEASLLIVGDGPERALYEKEARERGWHNVHFVGFVQETELPRYLALSDLFIFHTLYDPFGLVLSEAMAAKVPVVSSIHAAATGDLIEEGVTGFRIDPRDTEAAAGTILNVLKRSPEERTAMTEAAYERVKECDIEPSAEKMVQFMESLFESKERIGADPIRSKAVNHV
ncbi:MAG: glycosyltransferase family 4 protein [Nitrospirae bacterium]|nr:glycosyltransferase family 4 protein [Candidatus Manganitrophaceae bacterium]